MWNTLVFCDNDIFTGSDGNALQENFTALAQGQANAPALNVNSFIVTGIASISQLDVRSLASIQGLIVIDIGSFNEITVNSGIQAEVGCFRNVDVASNLSINGLNFPHFALKYDAGNPPIIVRQFNVSCLERHAVGIYEIHITSPTFTNTDYFLMGQMSQEAGQQPQAVAYVPSSSNLNRLVFRNSRISDNLLQDIGEGSCIIGFGD